MRKIIWFLFLSSLIFASNYSNKKTEIEFSVTKLSDSYEIKISAPTEGWVAIGFDGGMIMKDSEIIMLTNKNGNGIIEHHFGTSPISHKLIESLDKSYKNENLTLKNFSIAEGKSTYVFERSEKINNKFIKKFTKGKKIKVILSYSNSTDTSKKHKKADSLEIVLP